jgi:hypothetical protein
VGWLEAGDRDVGRVIVELRNAALATVLAARTWLAAGRPRPCAEQELPVPGGTG